MNDSVLFSVLLPLALGLVMAGLGLHLKVADFKRVMTSPRAVVIALAVQTLVMPPIAFLLVMAFDLPPMIGLGLILLAASPGGVTANLFSHLAHGDVALNVTLTGVNSILALITLPAWTALGLSLLLGSEHAVPPPTSKVLEVAALVVIPLTIGMCVREWKPVTARVLDRPVRIGSVIVLAMLTGAAIVVERGTLQTYFFQVGAICLAFNAMSLAAGYVASRWANLPIDQAIAISFEIGIHSGTLAIFVALRVLDTPGASVIPAIYSLVMYVTAAAAVVAVLRFWPPRPGVNEPS